MTNSLYVYRKVYIFWSVYTLEVLYSEGHKEDMVFCPSLPPPLFLLIFFEKFSILINLFWPLFISSAQSQHNELSQHTVLCKKYQYANSHKLTREAFSASILLNWRCCTLPSLAMLRMVHEREEGEGEPCTIALQAEKYFNVLGCKLQYVFHVMSGKGLYHA